MKSLFNDTGGCQNQIIYICDVYMLHRSCCMDFPLEKWEDVSISTHPIDPLDLLLTHPPFLTRHVDSVWSNVRQMFDFLWRGN